MRRSRSIDPAVLALLLTLAACAPESRPETLADLGGYDGRISIRISYGEQRRILRGALAFDRTAGRLRFAGTVDGRALSLVREGDGAPSLVGPSGSRGPLGPEDEGVFALLLSMIQASPGPDALVEATAGGYRVTAGGQVIEVDWLQPSVEGR
jgi:hypothetical protein